MSQREPIQRGRCHCGRVVIEVTGALPERIYDCNCSVCSKKAYLHWFVPRQRFRLLTAEDELATYTFNTGRAQHYFCKTCGVAPFYVARSHPDKIDVNVRCLDGVDPGAFEIVPFDGQNWEQAIDALRALTPD